MSKRGTMSRGPLQYAGNGKLANGRRKHDVGGELGSTSHDGRRTCRVSIERREHVLNGGERVEQRSCRLSGAKRGV